MLIVTDPTDNFKQVIYAGDDLREAWAILKDYLMNKCSLNYAMKVTEWWFTNNSSVFEILNGPYVDCWKWNS